MALSQDPPSASEPEPPKSVLEELISREVVAPRVHLRDVESGTGVRTPFVNPKSSTGEKFPMPKGRGNYQVLGEIARGGMGVVLKGHDSDLGRDVAFKVLDQKLAGRPEVVQRFVEEAQIGGQLQHPGIVPVYELGLMSDERPYFTMKLIKGRTLSELLTRRKDLGEQRQRFLSIFESVCQTVAYAHSKSVLHRDLKPANVMIGAFGEVQVVDWGLAKVLKRGGVEDELVAQRPEVTIIETVRSGPGSSGTDSQIGSVLGTPAYMPPEQAQGELEKLDERSDVFALGAILCEILTGKPPYVAKENKEVVAAAAHGRLDGARERLEAVDADPALKELCLECLSPAMQARPLNADELAVRVQLYLTSIEERAQQATLEAREERIKNAEQSRRHKLTVALGGTVLASLVGFGAVYFWLQGEEERRMQSVREGVDEAFVQVRNYQEAGRFDRAVEAAHGALAMLDSAGLKTGDLRRSAETTLVRAEERAAEEEAREVQEARNAALLARCEELRFERVAIAFVDRNEDPRGQIDRQYADAFREYGFDLESEDLDGALKVLREGGIAVEAALALDEWAALRRQIHGWDSFEVESLVALGLEVDPEPARTALREALFTQDKQAVLDFAARKDVPTLPSQTIWVLARALDSLGEKETVRRVLARAAKEQPDDFLVNYAYGDYIYDEWDLDFAGGLACLTVARTLRPENAFIHAMIGDLYSRLGNTPAAIDAYEDALEIVPDHWGVRRVAIVRYLLAGEPEKAEKMIRAQIEDGAGVPAEGILRVAQHFQGRVGARELAAWTDENQDRLAVDALRWCAWALCFGPKRSARLYDEAERHYRRVIERSDEFFAPSFNGLAWTLIQQGRPEEALIQLDRIAAEPSWGGVSEVHYSLNRALACRLLDRDEEARIHLARAETTFEELPYDPEGRWETSMVGQALREARDIFAGR